MEQLFITAITIICSIIGAVSAAFGIVKSMTEKHEKERKEREERQEALQLIILKSLDGALDLSISTATAISRIPQRRYARGIKGGAKNKRGPAPSPHGGRRFTYDA